jgi:hypothetical protein
VRPAQRPSAWITATVAVLALLVSYQANVSGVTGKAGDHQSGSGNGGAK